MNILQILKNSINTIYAKYMNKDEIEQMPIFYIAGSQTLPPPLSPEEEEELLEKLAQNDNDARQTLVERNLRLVVYIAKKFENTGVGIEDLISIGTIGLMKSINTFNVGKNIKLATYASRCIENEILMYLRRTEPDITSRRIEDEVDKSLLRASIEKLSNRERNIMELRFGYISGNEKTQKEVADMLRNITKLHI